MYLSREKEVFLNGKLQCFAEYVLGSKMLLLQSTRQRICPQHKMRMWFGWKRLVEDGHYALIQRLVKLVESRCNDLNQEDVSICDGFIVFRQFLLQVEQTPQDMLRLGIKGLVIGIKEHDLCARICVRANKRQTMMQGANYIRLGQSGISRQEKWQKRPVPAKDLDPVFPIQAHFLSNHSNIRVVPLHILDGITFFIAHELGHFLLCFQGRLLEMKRKCANHLSDDSETRRSRRACNNADGEPESEMRR